MLQAQLAATNISIRKMIMDSQNEKLSSFQIDEQVLRSFAKGQLDEATENGVAALLEKRPDLQSFVAIMSSNDLLKKMKDHEDADNKNDLANGYVERDGDSKEPGLKENDGAVNYSELEKEGQILAAKYKLREEIGEGGMGSVWLAEQLLSLIHI